MDEEMRRRRVAAAVDSLVDGLPPATAADAVEADLLLLARSLHGLGATEWPRDEAAFVAALAPAPAGRLSLKAVWPAAAAAVLAAALSSGAPAARFAAVAPAGAAGAIAQESAPLTFAAAAPQAAHRRAPVRAGVHGAPAVMGASGAASPSAATAPGLRGVWLQADTLALLGLPRGAGASLVARDLAGHARRIAAQAVGPLRILDFSGLAPGWYRLGSGRRSFVVLLPLPRGAAMSGRIVLAARDQATRLGGVRLERLDLSATGVVAQFAALDTAQAAGIELLGPYGPERPLATQVSAMPGKVALRLTFDPVQAGTGRLRFVVPAASGPPAAVKDVLLGP